MQSASSVPHMSATAKSGGTGWYWIVPRIAVVLFLLTIGAMI